MDVRKMRTFGWTRVELTSRPSRVLYPIAWGLLPLDFIFMMWLRIMGQSILAGF